MPFIQDIFSLWSTDAFHQLNVRPRFVLIQSSTTCVLSHCTKSLNGKSPIRLSRTVQGSSRYVGCGPTPAETSLFLDESCVFFCDDRLFRLPVVRKNESYSSQPVKTSGTHYPIISIFCRQHASFSSSSAGGASGAGGLECRRSLIFVDVLDPQPLPVVWCILGGYNTRETRTLQKTRFQRSQESRKFENFPFRSLAYVCRIV